MPRTDFSSRCT